MNTHYFIARKWKVTGDSIERNGDYGPSNEWFVCRICLRDYQYGGVTSHGEYIGPEVTEEYRKYVPADQPPLNIGWRIGPGWERQHGDVEICAMCIDSVLFSFGFKVPKEGAPHRS